MKQRVLLLTAAGMLVMTAAASAQSLGDVARREAERRKVVPAAGKVYTGDTLKPDPLSRPAAPARPGEAQPAAAAPSPSGVEGEAPKPEAAPESPAPRQDEKHWRDRIQAERDALQRAEMFSEALQSRINALSTDFASRDDPAQRSQIATDRQKALAEIDRVKQEIQQHTKNIATIQEEARRAGVPAGWVR
jgi:hypothetical protein